MMRKVLITGGLGYLGGRLAQFLASQESYEILLGSRWQTQAPSPAILALPGKLLGPSAALCRAGALRGFPAAGFGPNRPHPRSTTPPAPKGKSPVGRRGVTRHKATHFVKSQS